MGDKCIALVGDFDPSVTAHQAIPDALRLSAERLGVAVAPTWVHTASLSSPVYATLAEFAAVWCVPASPYANADGALAAIRFARESGRPFLGTCGGFQHAVIEYARNVLGLHAADHAETAPNADMPLIARLSCSLVEKSGTIFAVAGTRLCAAYGSETANETYHCNYGLNPTYEKLFAGDSDMRVCARDSTGDVRAVELASHPFFVATLFQPERSALRDVEHPLVTAFVAAVRNCRTA